MIELHRGQLSVIAIVIAIIVSGFGGYILNAKNIDVNKTNFNYITDISGQFEGKGQDIPVDFNPRENITGYYQGNVTDPDNYNFFDMNIPAIDYNAQDNPNNYLYSNQSKLYSSYKIEVDITKEKNNFDLPTYKIKITNIKTGVVENHNITQSQDVAKYFGVDYQDGIKGHVSRIYINGTLHTSPMGISLHDLQMCSILFSGKTMHFDRFGGNNYPVFVSDLNYNKEKGLFYENYYTFTYGSFGQKATIDPNRSNVVINGAIQPLESSYIIFGSKDSKHIEFNVLVEESNQDIAYIDARYGVNPKVAQGEFENRYEIPYYSSSIMGQIHITNTPLNDCTHKGKVSITTGDVNQDFKTYWLFEFEVFLKSDPIIPGPPIGQDAWIKIWDLDQNGDRVGGEHKYQWRYDSFAREHWWQWAIRDDQSNPQDNKKVYIWANNYAEGEEQKEQEDSDWFLNNFYDPDWSSANLTFDIDEFPQEHDNIKSQNMHVWCTESSSDNANVDITMRSIHTKSYDGTVDEVFPQVQSARLDLREKFDKNVTFTQWGRVERVDTYTVNSDTTYWYNGYFNSIIGMAISNYYYELASDGTWVKGEPGTTYINLKTHSSALENKWIYDDAEQRFIFVTVDNARMSWLGYVTNGGTETKVQAIGVCDYVYLEFKCENNKLHIYAQPIYQFTNFMDYTHMPVVDYTSQFEIVLQDVNCKSIQSMSFNHGTLDIEGNRGMMPPQIISNTTVLLDGGGLYVEDGTLTFDKSLPMYGTSEFIVNGVVHPGDSMTIKTNDAELIKIYNDGVDKWINPIDGKSYDWWDLKIYFSYDKLIYLDGDIELRKGHVYLQWGKLAVYQDIGEMQHENNDDTKPLTLTITMDGVWAFSTQYYEGVLETGKSLVFDTPGTWHWSKEETIVVFSGIMIAVQSILMYYRGYNLLDLLIMGGQVALAWIML